MDESNAHKMLVDGFKELYSEFSRATGCGFYAIAVCPYQSDLTPAPIVWSPSQIESMRNAAECVPMTRRAWQTAIGYCRHQDNERPLRSVAADAIEVSVCGTSCIASFVAQATQTAEESQSLMRQLTKLAERACALVLEAAGAKEGQLTGAAALSNWLAWLYAATKFDTRLVDTAEDFIVWRETGDSGDEIVTSRPRIEGELPSATEWLSRSLCRWIQFELHRDLFAASAETVRWLVERLNGDFAKIAEFKSLEHYWWKDRITFVVETPFGITIEPPIADKGVSHKPFGHVQLIEQRVRDWRCELDQDHKETEASINDYQRQCIAEEREAVAEISKKQAALEAELNKIAWERPFATEPVNSLDGIRKYLDQSASDLPGFAGTKLNDPEWRRSIYRNCVRALNHYCKQLSHSFLVEDASKTADAETDGLLTRLAKWMEKNASRKVARGLYLLGQAAGFTTLGGWADVSAAKERDEQDDKLVVAAHRAGVSRHTNEVGIVGLAVCKHLMNAKGLSEEEAMRFSVEEVVSMLEVGTDAPNGSAHLKKDYIPTPEGWAELDYCNPLTAETAALIWGDSLSYTLVAPFTLEWCCFEEPPTPFDRYQSPFIDQWLELKKIAVDRNWVKSHEATREAVGKAVLSHLEYAHKSPEHVARQCGVAYLLRVLDGDDKKKDERIAVVRTVRDLWNAWKEGIIPQVTDGFLFLPAQGPNVPKINYSNPEWEEIRKALEYLQALCIGEDGGRELVLEKKVAKIATALDRERVDVINMQIVDFVRELKRQFATPTDDSQARVAAIADKAELEQLTERDRLASEAAERTLEETKKQAGGVFPSNAGQSESVAEVQECTSPEYEVLLCYREANATEAIFAVTFADAYRQKYAMDTNSRQRTACSSCFDKGLLSRAKGKLGFLNLVGSHAMKLFEQRQNGD